MPERLSKDSNAPRISQKPALAAGDRAISTRSQPPFVGIIRAASLIHRFNRFLRTALPRRLLTEKPKRLTSMPLGKTRKASKGLPQDLPIRHTSMKRTFLARRRSLSTGN